MRSGFLKDAGKFLLGSAFAQILPFVATPFLAAYYTEEDFGIFGLFLAWFFILGKTLSLSYHQVILIPKSDERAKTMLSLSVYVAIISGVLITLIGFFPHIDYFYMNVLYGEISIGVFLFIINSAFENWLVRLGRYGLVSKIKAIRAIVTVVTSFIFWYVFVDFTGLVYSFLCGYFVSALILVLVNFSDFIKYLFDFQRLVLMARVYKNYSLYNSIAYLINNISSYSPTFFIEHNYGIQYQGYYYLTVRLIQSPLGMLGDAYGTVMFQKGAQLKRELIGPEFFKHLKFLLFFGMIISIIYLLFSDLIFFEVFEFSKWENVLPLSKIMIVSGVISIAFSIYNLPFKILNQNRKYLIWEFFRLVLVIGVLYFLSFLDFESYILWYAIGISVSYVALFIYSKLGLRI